ncbi:hypothetical protein [Hymenobacter amundsenii]|nr:hypothetical protein [Hymenobacter amundsenii]
MVTPHESVPTSIPQPPFPWLLLPGLAFTLLLLVGTLREWVVIGLVADPTTIAGYPFGSEEAMSDGGWYYQTAALYAHHMLIGWILLLPVCLSFAVAALRRARNLVLLAYALLAAILYFW